MSAMLFESDQKQEEREHRLGLATDTQTIPKGTTVHYKGIPLTILEDVSARGKMSVEAADRVELAFRYPPGDPRRGKSDSAAT